MSDVRAATAVYSENAPGKGALSAEHAKIVILVILLACIALNCFLNLGQGPIKDWDEARHGISAYEMLQNKSFLVNTFDNAPDYWNSKPPLSFWGVALGYKLFGYTPFGLRFFSALAAWATFMLVVLFCLRRLSIESAIFAACIFVSLRVLYMTHNARNADPDAMFLLFYVAGLLLVLAYPQRLLAYCAAAFLAGLAFLTKSFHAIPMVLLLLVYFFMDFPLSRRTFKQAALCLLAGLAPVLIWGISRWRVDGFLFFERMVFFDLFERSRATIEGHQGGLWYYFKYLLRSFKLWFFLALVCIPFALAIRKKMKTTFLTASPKGLLIKLLLAVLLPTILFSLASSKLPWYAYGACFFLAVLLAILFTRCRMLIWADGRVPALLFALCVFGITLYSEAALLVRISKFSDNPEPIQQSMKILGREAANHGGMLFLSQGAWTPASQLAARLYGGFVLREGGVAAYERIQGGEKAFLIDVAK